MSISAPVKYALCAAAALGTAYLAAAHSSKIEEAGREAFQNLQQCFTASGAKDCAIGAVSHLCSAIETGLRWSWNAATSPQAKWLAGAVVEYTPKAATALYTAGINTAGALYEYTPKAAYALYSAAVNAPGAALSAAAAVGDVLDAAGSFAKEAVSLPLTLAGGAASLLPPSISEGLVQSIQNLKGAVGSVNSKLAGALLPAVAYGTAKVSSLFSRLFAPKPAQLPQPAVQMPQPADQIVELGLPPEIQAMLGGRRVLLHFPADGQGPWGIAQAPQHLLMEAGADLLMAMNQNPALYNGIQDILLTIERPNARALANQVDEEWEEAPAGFGNFRLPLHQGPLAIAAAEL